jgi:hypothetical protein
VFSALLGKMPPKKVNFIRKRCCDPLNLGLHVGKKIKLDQVKVSLVEAAKQVNIALTTDLFICFTCRMRILKMGKEPAPSTSLNPAPQSAERRNVRSLSEITAMSTDSEPEVIAGSSSEGFVPDFDICISKLNEALPYFGISPINKKDVRSAKYIKSKVETIAHALENVLNKRVAKVDQEEDDSGQIIQALKSKFESAADRNEKYLILTTLPITWTTYRIMNEFGVSQAMAMRSKELVLGKGIMSAPSVALNKRAIDNSIIDAVKRFYLSDDISYACPGQRDYILIRSDDGKEKRQRRLLLINLKEAYKFFKAQYPDLKIGFSKFALLRPRECILGQQGLHSTCVCMYHQNFKLMFEPLKKMNMFAHNVTDHKDLIRTVLCADTTENCCLNECENCPGRDELQNTLESKLDDRLIENLSMKQWIMDSGAL